MIRTIEAGRGDREPSALVAARSPLRATAAAFAIVLLQAANPAPGAQDSPRRDSPGAAATIVAQGLGEELDEHLSALVAFGFHGSVLVAKDGAVVLCKGYGLADREKKRAHAPDTLFDIGSLAKQFTAAAILKLEEQGKLKTSDFVSKHLGETPEDKRAITLHHLLTQTSGLPREVPIRSATKDRDALVKAAYATKLRSKPGEQFGYANANFDLLGAVVEVASGKRFEEYVAEELFRPAGLERTRFLQDPAIDVERCAVGYEGETRTGSAHEGWYSWGLRGAGGALSSVVELDRWWRALEDGKVLSKASRDKLFAPNLLDYACGWWVQDFRELGRTIRHEGTTRGFEAAFACDPERALRVIVLCNDHGICKTTAWTLAHAGAGLPYEKASAVAGLAPESIRACEGTFVAGKSGQARVRALGAQLALELSPEAVVLLATGREAKTLSQDEELAEKVSEVLVRMRAGDAAGLAPLLSPNFPGWNRTLVGVWSQWCRERGAYVRHRLLGIERSGDAPNAFVALEHEERSATLSMRFVDGLFSGFELDGGLRAGPAFVARSENEFVWKDLAAYGGSVARLLFERDAKGRATMLTVTVGEGVRGRTLLAKRKKGGSRPAVREDSECPGTAELAGGRSSSRPLKDLRERE